MLWQISAACRAVNSCLLFSQETQGLFQSICMQEHWTNGIAVSTLGVSLAPGPGLQEQKKYERQFGADLIALGRIY